MKNNKIKMVKQGHMTEAIPPLQLEPTDMTTCIHKCIESALAAIKAQ